VKNVKTIKENGVHILYGVYKALIIILVIYLFTFIPAIWPFDIESLSIKIYNYNYIFGLVCFFIMSIGNFMMSKYKKDYSVLGVIIIVLMYACILYAYKLFKISNVFYTTNILIPIIILLVLILVSYITYKYLLSQKENMQGI
jgi:peptidoglycan/LPS O-acetylase OafA/YrhL